MAVMTTGTFPQGLWPGIHDWYGLGYKEHEQQYKKIFDVRNSTKAYEKVVEATGFGLAPSKSEGGGVSYDAQTQGPTTTATHTAFALGFICTYEEKNDGQYAELMYGRSRALGFSMRTTKEIVHANLLNRATDGNYTFGDGKSMLATDHVTRSGDQANEPATAVDFSEAALEDLVTQIRDAKNNRGLQVPLQPGKLIIPTALEWDATRVLESRLQSGTANNDVNALKFNGAIKEIVINNYLTDSDQWFVTTDAPTGLISFQRDSVGPSEDNDFDTMNWRVMRYDRFEPTMGDFRSIYGSPGA